MYKAIAADVLLHGKVAGTLSRDNLGRYQFRYKPNHPKTRPLSFSLPVKTEAYQGEDMPAYFDNLLPEGWLLHTSRKELKLDDPFALLIELGKDLPGAVTLRALRNEQL